MENLNLNMRLLDTAIKTMERNRTLLFTINLIAALILVVVYLERYSFDYQQQESHLIAFQERCELLNKALETVPNWNVSPQKDKNEFKACSDLDAINAFVITNSPFFPSTETKEASLKEIGKSIFRLHVIQNDMKAAKLETANVTPLGFGLTVPRNDLVIICGVLLVILYSWLAFSFSQHARIIEKIKLLFQESEPEEHNRTQTTLNELIELNFLFRTSTRNLKEIITTIFVRTLYLSAPLAMTIANINDFYLPDATQKYLEYINELWEVPRIIEIVIMLILWGISISILNSDRRTNTDPITPSASEKPTDAPATGL